MRDECVVGRDARGAGLLGAVAFTVLGGLAIWAGWRRAQSAQLPVHPFGDPTYENPPTEPLASPLTPRPAPCADVVGAVAPASVLLHSGELRLTEVDLSIRGRGLDFVWARTYRSRLGPTTSIGNGWDFSYNVWIEPSGQDVVLHDGMGRADLLTRRIDDTFVAEGFFREGKFELDGRFTLTFADKGTWTFHPASAGAHGGRLELITDRNGNALSFDYVAGKLTTITDTLARTISIAYDGLGRMQSVTDFVGRQVIYSYYEDGDAGGSAGDLKSTRTPIVVGTPHGNDYPLGKTTVYTYSKGFADERLDHNLLTVTDPKGQTWMTNVYGNHAGGAAFDRVRVHARGGPNDTYEIVYVKVPKLVGDASPEVVRAIVNDPVGNVQEHFFDARGRRLRTLEFTGRAVPGQATTATANRPINPLRPDDPPFFETRYEHNADSLVTRVVHANGNETLRVHELELDPAAPWRARGNLRSIERIPGNHAPIGDQTSIVETFEYQGGFGACCGTHFVTRHVDARGQETTHDYDAFGNREHTQHPIASVVEDFTYNGRGQLRTHTWPDNGSGHRRVDEYVYYGISAGAQNGYLKQSIVDAGGLGLTTSLEPDAVGNVLRIVDPQGHDTLRTYNALDQLVRERSPQISSAGDVRYERLFHYDANDNLERIDVENRDHDGALRTNAWLTTEREFDVLNELTSVTEEVDDGVTVATEHAYDANRNRTLTRRGEAVNGNQPANTVATLHDERNLPWRVVRAQGSDDQATVQYDYDRNGNLRAERDGIDFGFPHVTEHVYDAYDRVLATIDAMGNVREYRYDPAGNLGGNQSESPPVPNPFGMRILGELVDVEGDAGNVRLYEATYRYDALGRRIEETVEFFDLLTQQPIDDGQVPAGKSITQWTYTPASQVAQVIDDRLNASTSAYDTALRVASVTDARGNVKSFTYDDDSSLIEQEEVDLSDVGAPPATFTTLHGYDELHRRISTTDPGGHATETAYDSRDNATLSTDALGHGTRFDYDGLSRLVATRRDMNANGEYDDAEDIVTTQAWDASSRLTAQIDDKGNATRYAHDALDRRIVTRMADGTLHQVGFGATWASEASPPNLTNFFSGYDLHGNVDFATDAIGTNVLTTFDDLDRAVLRSIALGAGVAGVDCETYEYDGLSRVVVGANNDAIVSREHDSLSHVTSEMLCFTPGSSDCGEPRTRCGTTVRAYDGVGNVVRTTYPGGRVVDTTYDVLNRKKTLADDTGSDTETEGICAMSYAGGCPLRVEEIAFDTRSRLDSSSTGVVDAFSYDSDRRVIGSSSRLDPRGANVEIDVRSYEWSATHDKTARVDLRVGGPELRHDYAYDDAHRLVGTQVTDASQAVLRDTTYVLDGVGNRLSVVDGECAGTYTMSSAAPEPADEQVNQYTTTGCDARTYDRNGNLKSIDLGAPTQRVFVYDYANRLIEHFIAGGQRQGAYRYDVFGRRVEADHGAYGTIRYYYGDWQVLEERDPLDQTAATYTYGSYIDEVLTMRRDVDGDTFFEDYSFHRDSHYNVVAVVDAFGTTIERYEYGDYGVPSMFDVSGALLQVSAVSNTRLFGGREYQEETQLYCFRTRMFDPQAGRFTTRDSIGSWRDRVNLGNGVAFVGNSPATRLDPDGRQSTGTEPFVPDWIRDHVGGIYITMPPDIGYGTNPPPTQGVPGISGTPKWTDFWKAACGGDKCNPGSVYVHIVGKEECPPGKEGQIVVVREHYCAQSFLPPCFPTKWVRGRLDRIDQCKNKPGSVVTGGRPGMVCPPQEPTGDGDDSPEPGDGPSSGNPPPDGPVTGGTYYPPGFIGPLPPGGWPTRDGGYFAPNF